MGKKIKPNKMAVTNDHSTQRQRLHHQNDDEYDEHDEWCYNDQYEDYDDFAISTSRGGGGRRPATTSRASNRTKGKNGGRGAVVTIYSSKHIRAKESLRAG